MKSIQKSVAGWLAVVLIAVTPFAAATEGQGLPIGAPEPVTNIVLGAFVGDTTERSVSWSAPENNGGSAITGYTATAMTGANFTTATGATCSVPAGTTTCSIIGMSFGTAYKIQIVATNAVGSSTPALSTEFTTPSLSQTVTITGAPANVTFGSGTTQLSATATSGLPVTWSSSTSNVCTIDNTGRITYLTTGTCTVVATQDGSGSSYAAATSTATITVGANLSANATGATSITGTGATLAGNVPYPGAATTVAFCIATTNSNADCTTPAGITIGAASPSTITSSSGANTSTTVSGLSSSVTYYYWVEATSGGVTEKSNTSSFTTLVAPTVSQSGPTSGQQNSSFTTTITASGGSGVFLNWAVDTLPTGLALSPSGATATISGTPSVVGSTNSTITVTDSNNLQASIQLTFSITAPPPPAPVNDPVIDTTVDLTPTPSPSPSPSVSPSASPSASPSPSPSGSETATPSPSEGETPGGNDDNNGGTGGNSGGNTGGNGGEPIPDSREPVTTPSGELPKPSSGEGVVIQGGVVEPIKIEVVKSEKVQATFSGVVLQVAIKTSENDIRSVPQNAGLTGTRGDFISIVGEGYQTGTRVIAWLFSTPIRLGEIEVDANGKCAGDLLIPANIDLRDHTLQINGVKSDSTGFSVALKLVVVDSQNAPKPIDDSSDGNNGSDSGGGTAVTKKPVFKTLFFKTGTSKIDTVNKKRIKKFRAKSTSSTTLQCVGYTPKKPKNLKKAKALAKAQATAACKQFIKVYKKSSKRVYKVTVKSISKAPATKYKRSGKTQRIDLRLLKK